MDVGEYDPLPREELEELRSSLKETPDLGWTHTACLRAVEELIRWRQLAEAMNRAREAGEQARKAH